MIIVYAIVLESGVDAIVEKKFPGAKVTYGSAASGRGDNRAIPLEEGGDIKPDGRLVLSFHSCWMHKNSMKHFRRDYSSRYVDGYVVNDQVANNCE